MGASETEAGAGRLRLKVVGGNAAGTVIEVEGELLIGRQAPGDGTLGNDIEISRRHARISAVAGGGFQIEDLGSTNGTWVNGARADRPTALEIGDRIEVGGSELVVQIGAIPERTPAAGTEVPAAPRAIPVESDPVEPAVDPPAPAAADPAPPPPAAAAPPGPAAAAGEPASAAAAGASEPPGPPGRLSLRIDVDLDALQATVSLDEGADAVTLRYEDGRWRLGSQ